MSKHFVAVETAPGLPDSGKMFAVDPSAASGIPLPSFKMVSVLPKVGNIIGEGYFVTTSRTGFAWDGRIFQPITPTSLLTYTTDAAVYADNTQPPGSYAVSADTGNLFIMGQVGWRAANSRTYSDLATANTETNVNNGQIAWLIAEQMLVVRIGTRWERVVDTPRMTVSAALPATPIAGDMHYDPTNKKLQIYDGAAWAWAYYGAIVGEIKQSTLTEAQFATAVGAIEAPKWKLCNGQTCAGTDYATITTKNTVPDLRGSFLRGAGQNSNASWTGPALNAYQEDSTKRPNSALTGTTSDSGNHDHGMAGLNVICQDLGNHDVSPTAGGNREGIRNFSWSGNHSHTVTINGGGDAETRPKSYGINFFIKVSA